jgi:hypothetical protein
MTMRRNDDLVRNGGLSASPPLLHAVVLRFLPATSGRPPDRAKRAEQMRQYCHFIPIVGTTLPDWHYQEGRVRSGKMDEALHLASAALTIALAAVLLVFSYFFLEAQSARHPSALDSFALRPGQVALYQSRGF